MSQLEQLPGVRVIPKTPELKWRQEHSRIWNETWLSAFFHKPCNHELFVQQSLNMEGVTCLAHLILEESFECAGPRHGWVCTSVEASMPAALQISSSSSMYLHGSCVMQTDAPHSANSVSSMQHIRSCLRGRTFVNTAESFQLGVGIQLACRCGAQQVLQTNRHPKAEEPPPR